MITSNKLKDTDTLENYRLVLDKAESIPGIAEALAGIGYHPEKLEEGKDLLQSARDLYNANIRVKDDLAFAFSDFTKQKEVLEYNYRIHRRKTRLLLRENRRFAEKLAVTWKYPRKYVLWMEMVRKFYRESDKSAKIQAALMKLNLTKAEIKEGVRNIEELDHLRARWIMLKGESQRTTVIKNVTYDTLRAWMSSFFGAARLALVKEPELLEALVRPLNG